ncbi:MAG: hypothetical protein ACM31L_12070 [Actinomycetota bacterium]
MSPEIETGSKEQRPDAVCSHCGETKALDLRSDEAGLVVWCQVCFRVTEVRGSRHPRAIDAPGQ